MAGLTDIFGHARRRLPSGLSVRGRIGSAARTPPPPHDDTAGDPAETTGPEPLPLTLPGSALAGGVTHAPIASDPTLDPHRALRTMPPLEVDERIVDLRDGTARPTPTTTPSPGGRASPGQRPTDGSPAGRRALPRMPALEGLRAIAVLAVLLYHAEVSWIPGGFLGVDVFFVLSGFLITSLLLHEIDGTGRIRLRSFYRRRARRLLPALFLVLIGAALLGVTVATDAATQLQRDIPAALTYVTNWVYISADLSYFDAVGRPPMLEHLWSLAVEEQFYLLWPVVLILAARRGGVPMVRRWAMIGAVASTLWMTVLSIRHGLPVPNDPSRVYFGTDTHAMGLMVGAALATWWRPADVPSRTGIVHRLGVDIVALTGLLVLGWVFWQVSEYSGLLFRGGFLLLSVLVAVVIVAVTHPASLVGRAMGRQPLRYLGQRSYGLYLWHWPVFVVTRPGGDLAWDGWWAVVGRIGLTMLLAELSYRLVEDPIRRHGVGAWWQGVLGVLSRAGDVGLRLARRPVLVLVLAGILVAGLGWRLYSIPSQQDPDYLGGVTALSAIPDGATVTLIPSPLKPSVSQTAAPQPLVQDGYLGIGESVMIGARRVLESRLQPLRIDAEVGRQPSDLPVRIRQLAAAGALATQTFIHTGSNGYLRGDDLRSSLELLEESGVRHVVVVNVSVPRRWSDPNNELIDAIADEFDFATAVDWEAATATDEGYLVSDRIHPTASGMRAYVDLIEAGFERLQEQSPATPEQVAGVPGR